MKKIVVISGPYGCGIYSIVNELLENKELNLRFPIVTTSRTIRSGETNGVDYYFINQDEFRKKIVEDEFIEYEEITGNIFYGTEKEEIERGERNIIIQTDPDTAWNIKQKYKDRVFIIFMKPGSIDIIWKRLVVSGRLSYKEIEERIKQIRIQISKADIFDYVAINSEDGRIIGELAHKIKEFINLPDSYYLKRDAFGIDAICEILSFVNNRQQKLSFYGVPRYIYRGVSSFIFQKDAKSPMVSTEFTIKSGLNVRLERTYDAISKKCLHSCSISKINELINNAMREFPNKYSNSSELEILADIQHNGGATCLIDFSKNILIALWFACQNDFDNDALLYCYNTKQDIERETLVYVQHQESVEIEKLFAKTSHTKNIINQDCSLFYLWQPSAVNNRIVRQDSIFLLGLDEFYVLEHNHDVLVIRISADKKQSIKQALASYFNISEETIYNDEVGMALSNAKLKPYMEESGGVIEHYQDAILNIRKGYYTNALEQLKRYQGNVDYENLEISKRISLHFYLAVCYRHMSFEGIEHSYLYNSLLEYVRVIEQEEEVVAKLKDRSEELEYCYGKIFRSYNEIITLCYVLECYDYGVEICEKILMRICHSDSAPCHYIPISVKVCLMIKFELQILSSIQNNKTMDLESLNIDYYHDTYSKFETLIIDYYKLIYRIYRLYADMKPLSILTEDILLFQKRTNSLSCLDYQPETASWDFIYIKNVIERIFTDKLHDSYFSIMQKLTSMIISVRDICANQERLFK